MRIGVDVRALTVPVFGIGRYTHAMLTEMCKYQDHEWYFYADRPIINPVANSNATERVYNRSNQILSLIRTQLGFAKWARQDQLDVFWSPRHHLPIPLSSSIASVVTIHDMVWKLFPETMLGKNLLVERLLMPPSLRRADSIVAVSDATRQDVKTFYPKVASRLRMIPEAAFINPSVEGDDPPESVQEPYFLFVGTLEPRKNLPKLLEAFALYRSQGGRYPLVVVGAKGWKSQALKTDVEGVLFPGYVPDEELVKLYSSAEALVCPSLYEGFGLPALEAMTLGTPVIASNCSALPEVVGEAGILVEPSSREQIAKALAEMEIPEVRSLYASHTKPQAEKFSWTSSASQLLALFEKVQYP